MHPGQKRGSLIRAVRITASFLGIYAGLLGIQHGVFEMLQGPAPTSGMLIQAIGPPCQPEYVWHACYPAMTLLPTYLSAGLFSILIGLAMAFWAGLWIGRARGGLVQMLLSVGLLLVGGGFVPAYVGFLSGATGSLVRTSAPRPRRLWLIFAGFYPWTLILLALWLPGAWIFAHFFAQTMLDLSPLFFFLFDLVLPFFGVLAAIGTNAAAGSH